MKIRVLGAFGAEGLGQRASAFLVNDRVLVDAGTVTGGLTVPEQLEVEHAVLTHAHLDHLAGLVYLTETFACWQPDVRTVTVSAVTPVLEAVQATVFNNILWPDFSRIPDPRHPVVRYQPLLESREQKVGGLWVTPVPVSHSVPAYGFVVHDGGQGFVFSGDTGPTEALWAAARALGPVKAVVLECAFPDRLRELAGIAKHMTPALVQRELAKLPADVPVWIYHIKPQFLEEIAEELARFHDPRLVILEQDKTYEL
jgi:ribonuclease BN (tRNA processing enzyme)